MRQSIIVKDWSDVGCTALNRVAIFVVRLNSFLVAISSD